MIKNINYDYVLDFARKKHEGQLRADGTPYIYHPIMVAEIVQQYKKSRNMEMIIAGALLHDVLEDTYTSYRELEDNFGEEVASLVMEVTTAGYMPKLVGKDNYLSEKMVNMSSYALVIKLADRLANIIDGRVLSEERKKRIIEETKNILDFLERNRDLTNAQQDLVYAIRTQIKNDENK